MRFVEGRAERGERRSMDAPVVLARLDQLHLDRILELLVRGSRLHPAATGSAPSRPLLSLLSSLLPFTL
eukprot:scaffold89242_cov35-Tisochrysis_lutea.AAC.3